MVCCVAWLREGRKELLTGRVRPAKTGDTQSISSGRTHPMIPKAENQGRRRIGCKPDNRRTLFAYREKEDRRVLGIRARKIRNRFQESRAQEVPVIKHTSLFINDIKRSNQAQDGLSIIMQVSADERTSYYQSNPCRSPQNVSIVSESPQSGISDGLLNSSRSGSRPAPMVSQSAFNHSTRSQLPWFD